MGKIGKNVYRLAPSPSGLMHIGNARTFVFNYLLAKHTGSKLILRIEDTDLQRSTPEFEQAIINGLKWLGIEWDEFYRQSERNRIYQDYANLLINEGKAYLEDGAVKFKVRATIININDSVRGNIKFDTNLQDDFVLIKSNGSPGFHWANVVDDHEMGITHVIRGEDHISNTSKQLLLYEVMGWEPPEYGHISLILAMDKSKLSKRNGAMSIDQLRDEGYLPGAVFNFIALLGWAPTSNDEIFPKAELISMYSIDRVSKSNSIFNIEKLKWMNKEYMKRLTLNELVKFIPNGTLTLAEMIRPKLNTLLDIPKCIEFLDEPTYEGTAPKWFNDFIGYFNIHDAVEPPILINSYATTNNIPKNDMFSAVRYGITGSVSGLPLFQVIDYLGRDECIRRMRKWLF